MEKKNTQIHIANWELGDVFPPGEGSKKIKEEILKSLPLNMTNPAKYGKNDIGFIYD